MHRSHSILFLNHNLRGKGTFFRNFHLARTLAALGWNTTVMTVCASRSLTARVDFCRGVKIIETPQFLVSQRYAASGFCPLDSAYRCLKIATTRFDVIFLSDHLPDVSIPFCTAKFLKPSTLFVADWADLFSDGGLHAHWNTGLGKVAYQLSCWLELAIKRRSDLCTATSRPLMRLLQEKAGIPATRCLHIPSGCDVNIEFPPSRLYARSLVGLPEESLIVGRTCSSDLITETEVDAMVALAQHYRELTGGEVLLYLIGPCNPAKYPKLFGSVTQIRFTGKLKPEQIPPHLAACDLFLLVEDAHPNCQFRGPIRLNDYLAAGRPVVCNSVGDHVQTLMQHDACVVCDDYRTPNAALDVILTSADAREDMGGRSRQLAEGELSWDSLAQRLEQFILGHTQGKRI